jgi:hypothetical protein
MDSQWERDGDSWERPPVAGYEPPRIERVLAPTELEREVLYAGGTATGGTDADSDG